MRKSLIDNEIKKSMQANGNINLRTVTLVTRAGVNILTGSTFGQLIGKML